jgi:RNA polymerase sigma factor (sigma-70 family)
MALCDALRSLPARQREVVILRYVTDLSQEDVASALGISTGAVKQHAARGCAHLRRWFEANWEGGRDDISALG